MSRLAALALALALAVTLGAGTTHASPVPASETLVVSATGPFTTIEAALSDARDGDTIEVRGGAYAGPLVVEKSVRLIGSGWPVIDGGGQGTVVTLSAAGVEFRGFEVRGSGDQPDRNHAGITLTAPNITVEGTRLREVLFGIFVAQADGAVLRGNDVESLSRYEIARKGDAIRLWYSRDVTVEGNHVHDARDVVMWYSSGVVVRDNLIERGRYGVHLMYCDGAAVEGNRLRDNSVGVFTMYSNRVTVRQNLIRGQRGPSGYALGFKDADNVEVTENVLVDNRAGMFLDGTPFSPEGKGRFDRNTLAYNDVGVILLPAVRGAAFAGNTFWENGEGVSVQGGGALGENFWRSNYWSDYAGFDADGDGRGDVPYEAERLFESLTDREPTLRALSYSPAVQAIEFAASAFPIVRPQPKLTDPSPSAAPGPLPGWIEPPRRQTGPMLWAGLGLIGLGTVVGAAGYLGGRRTMKPKRAAAGEGGEAKQMERDDTAGPAARAVTLRVENVGKRYGSLTALEGVTFEARAGEALALWGANGAGKTTLLKAILGLVDFEGAVSVAGQDARQAGKAARFRIGYVPQEAVFYDLSVQATMEFYARLKRTRGAAFNPAERIPGLLERLGLEAHARKPVPALSGGLKQRLALAIALLADPPVLLLDEPTANLDAKTRRDYLSLLSALLREHKTLIFASHRMEEVLALADRVLMLDAGRCVGALTPEQLRERWMSEMELTLWVPEAQRHRALSCLTGEGLAAHLNGRGTVVVRVRGDEKMKALNGLGALGIPVLDFQLE